MLFGPDQELLERQANLLARARLEGADLLGANLRWAVLLGANLEGANLRGADLRGANLRRARLERAEIEEAMVDEETVVPDSTHWTPSTDLSRFTDPQHPRFWRLNPLEEDWSGAETT